MAEVRVGKNESLDTALKRFKRSCAKDGVIAEVDCCYGNCVYQGSCLIAKEIDGLK